MPSYACPSVEGRGRIQRLSSCRLERVETMLDRVAERLIYLAGASSQRGDGRRTFSGLLHYLASAAGLEDAREASYRAAPDGTALEYDRPDTAVPLGDSVRAVQ